MKVAALAGRKFGLCLALLLLGVFSLRAQDIVTRTIGSVRVYFPLDNAELSDSYLENSGAFAALDSLIESAPLWDSFLNLELRSYSSLEGPYAHNVELSKARANALAQYLIRHWPDVESHLQIIVGDEAWEDFREAVANDPKLSEEARQRMLTIIDSDADPDVKGWRLKKCPEYSTAARHFVRQRYADLCWTVITPDGNAVQYVTPETGTETETEQETEQITEQETEQETVPVIIPPVQQEQETETTEATETAVAVSPAKPGKTMIAAVKTNLLFDAVTALNVEVEIPIGKRFSIMAEDVFPWWEFGNKYCLQLWEMGVEARFWFKPWEKGMEKLRGLFVGPYVMSGKYDFQLDKSVNYQGEFWSAGVTAGYAMPIGKKKKVNLEFSLSLGYLESPFRHYQPTDDYTKLIKDPAGNGTFYDIFIYPTKAKVSLVVPIGVRTSKKEVSHE